MFGFHIQVIHRADQFQPAQHAKHAVILAARRLRIQVRANINRKCVRVRPFAPREHITHLIQPHGTTRCLAPALEQVAAFAVFISDGLAVITACDTGADLGHLHQAVPQAIRVDFEVLAAGCHGTLRILF